MNNIPDAGFNLPAGTPPAREQEESFTCGYCSHKYTVLGWWELGGWAPIRDDDLICPNCLWENEDVSVSPWKAIDDLVTKLNCDLAFNIGKIGKEKDRLKQIAIIKGAILSSVNRTVDEIESIINFLSNNDEDINEEKL